MRMGADRNWRRCRSPEGWPPWNMPGTWRAESGSRPRSDSQSTFMIRAYQFDAVEKTMSAWGIHDRVLGVAPTGSGKTVIFAEVLRRRMREGPALVLAHREELLGQARDKLESAGLWSELERAGSKAGLDSPVVVASVQTLARARRLSRWPVGHFRTVVIDEAHHAPADSYRRIMDGLQPGKVLGVTATPSRSGGGELGDVFDSIAFELRFADLVRDGFLSRVTVETVPLKIDLEGVKRKAGDFVASDLDDRIGPHLEAAVAEITTLAKGRRVLMFLPLRKTSTRCAELARAAGWRAEHVDGESADRAEVLARFASGETNLVCNASLLTEGFDCPAVDCVVPLRPTKSKALYQQMVGRGTRLAPGKRDCLLIDFLWKAERMQIARPASLVTSEDVAIEDGDIVTAVEEATRRAEQRDRADRERALAKELERTRARSADLVDPHAWGEWCESKAVTDFRAHAEWQRHRPSEKQLETIERFGIDPAAVESRGHGAAIIDLLFLRKARNLCTPRQMRALHRHGLSVNPWMNFQWAQSLLSNLYSKPANRR